MSAIVKLKNLAARAGAWLGRVSAPAAHTAAIAGDKFDDMIWDETADQCARPAGPGRRTAPAPRRRGRPAARRLPRRVQDQPAATRSRQHGPRPRSQPSHRRVTPRDPGVQRTAPLHRRRPVRGRDGGARPGRQPARDDRESTPGAGNRASRGRRPAGRTGRRAGRTGRGRGRRARSLSTTARYPVTRRTLSATQSAGPRRPGRRRERLSRKPRGRCRAPRRRSSPPPGRPPPQLPARRRRRPPS